MPQNMLYPQLESPESPLESCSEQLKQYFKQAKVGNSLPDLNPGFEAKPMSKQKCTKKIKPDQKYYHCKQCAFDQNLDRMILCGDCYVPARHEGHTVEEKLVGNDQYSCDCGRALRIKKSGFCQTHSNGHKIVQLSEQDGNKFNQFYISLFKILIFLESKNQPNITPLVSLISKSISSLCKDSLYYIRLATKMLSSEITVGNVTVNLFRKVLEHKQFIQMIEEMSGDEQFLLQIGKQFFKMEQEGNFGLFSFNTLLRELMDSHTFLISMSKNGIYFPDQIANYFNAADYMKDEKQKQTLISEFISFISSKTDSIEYVEVVCNILKHDRFDFLNSQKFLNHILNSILKLFKTTEEASSQKKQEQIQQNQQQKKEQKKEVSAEQKSMLKKSLSILSKVLQKKSNRNIKMYEKCLDQLLNENQSMNGLLQNLTSKFLNAELFSDLNSEKYRQLFLVLLLIISKLSNNPTKKSKLLTKVWKSVIQSDKNFYENLDNIYGIIAYLACSYRTFPLLGGKQQVFEKMTEIQQRETLLRSYLFERKQVGKKQLWTQYTEGWLKFNSCGRILQELCQYNDGHQTFVYKSKNSYPNGCARIPSQLAKNWENVRKLDLNYESENLTQSETLLKFFLIVFKQEEFFKVFYESFSKGMESVEKQPRNLERWKSRGVGQNYVIILLLIDKLCHGQEHHLIKQEIEKIKQNKEQYRFRFTEIGSEQKIKKLLCVDPPIVNEPKIELTEVKQQQKTAEQVKKQQILKKSQQKKQKLLNKMKQKQKQMLQKMKNEKSSVYEEEEENFCLSCKERQKKENEFINLAHLSKGNTISQILHADQSKTCMKILTNMHTIHLNCFKEMKKKNMEFQCPLCKQNINCFLPYRPNRASKLLMDICWNVINAVLVSNFNTYETGSLFEVLLISLVESLGFTELLSARKSKNVIKQKNKGDLYMIDMLTCIYSFSNTEQEREKYKQVYTKLLQKIKTCTKKQLELFQLVILQAIFFRISGEIEVDSSIVEQLSKIMVQDEFNILKNTIIFITEGNSDVISSFEDLSLSKISEFSYNESPGKLKQQITSMDLIPESVEENSSKQPETTQITPKMQEETKEVQTQPQRKSLGINIWTPPKKFVSSNIKNFMSSLSNSELKCVCESEKIESVCLICKRKFCDKCEEDKLHQQLHLNNYILLNLQSLKLQIKKNGKNEKQDIYFNQFMIEYKKQDDDGSDSEEDEDDPLNIFAPKKTKKKTLNEQVYYLNMNKFNETVEKFYNIIG